MEGKLDMKLDTLSEALGHQDILTSQNMHLTCFCTVLG